MLRYQGKVDFLSEEWQDLYKHAVKEAERLGIRIILGSGPGWAGSGGPWVTPERSMMHLVSSDTTVSGPSSFKGRLPLPLPKKPFFGEGSLTQELRQKRNDWYEDEFVLAFSFTRPVEIVPRILEKALYYGPSHLSRCFLLSGSATIMKRSCALHFRIIDLPAILRTETLTGYPRGRWTMRFGGTMGCHTSGTDA
jgi:hypothetical protein